MDGKRNEIRDLMLEQINLLANWNREAITSKRISDVEQVRKNLDTMTDAANAVISISPL